MFISLSIYIYINIFVFYIWNGVLLVEIVDLSSFTSPESRYSDGNSSLLIFERMYCRSLCVLI